MGSGHGQIPVLLCIDSRGSAQDSKNAGLDCLLLVLLLPADQSQSEDTIAIVLWRAGELRAVTEPEYKKTIFGQGLRQDLMCFTAVVLLRFRIFPTLGSIVVISLFVYELVF